MTVPSQLPTVRPEFNTYESALPQLMARHCGEFVVIHGDEVANFFADRNAALEWAYEAYGLDPFFVKHISPEENVAHFIRDVGPCSK